MITRLQESRSQTSRAFPRGALPRRAALLQKEEPEQAAPKGEGAGEPGCSHSCCVPGCFFLQHFSCRCFLLSLVPGLVPRTGELRDGIAFPWNKTSSALYQNRPFSPHLPCQGVKQAANPSSGRSWGTRQPPRFWGFGVLGCPEPPRPRHIPRGRLAADLLPCAPLAAPCLGDTSPPALG